MIKPLIRSIKVTKKNDHTAIDSNFVVLPFLKYKPATFQTVEFFPRRSERKLFFVFQDVQSDLTKQMSFDTSIQPLRYSSTTTIKTLMPNRVAPFRYEAKQRSQTSGIVKLSTVT